MLSAIGEYILNQISTNWFGRVKSISLAVVVFLLVYWIIKRIISHIKKRIESRNIEYTVEQVEKVSKSVATIVFIILMTFNVLMVLEVLGINVALLMAGLSLGIAFSLETVISNMIAGVIILTNKKIKIGMLIEMHGDLNTYGTVEDISIRYTIVRTFDGRRVIIPNIVLAQVPIKTLKEENIIRGDIEITIPRWADLGQAKDLLKKVVNKNVEVVSHEYTSNIVSDFDEKGTKIKTFFFIKPEISGGGISVRSSLRESIINEFRKFGIKIPYNHISIDMER